MDANEQVTLQVVVERLKGLDRVTRQGFKGLDEKFETVKELPVVVAELSTEVKSHGRRLEVIEDNDDRSHEWRRGQLPTLVLTLAIVILGAVQIFH